MEKNQKASFWQYTGNHPNGRDCSRSNPYGYPVDLVAYTAHYGGEAVKVSRKKNDGFGNEVIVSAPQATWEANWVKLADEIGAEEMNGRPAPQRSEDGGWWVRDDGLDGDIWIECHRRGEDENPLEMAKKGYARFFVDGKEFWIESEMMAMV